MVAARDLVTLGPTATLRLPLATYRLSRRQMAHIGRGMGDIGVCVIIASSQGAPRASCVIARGVGTACYRRALPTQFQGLAAGVALHGASASHEHSNSLRQRKERLVCTSSDQLNRFKLASYRKKQQCDPRKYCQIVNENVRSHGFAEKISVA